MLVILIQKLSFLFSIILFNFVFYYKALCQSGSQWLVLFLFVSKGQTREESKLSPGSRIFRGLYYLKFYFSYLLLFLSLFLELP